MIYHIAYGVRRARTEHWTKTCSIHTSGRPEEVKQRHKSCSTFACSCGSGDTIRMRSGATSCTFQTRAPSARAPTTNLCAALFAPTPRAAYLSAGAPRTSVWTASENLRPRLTYVSVGRGALGGAEISGPPDRIRAQLTFWQTRSQNRMDTARRRKRRSRTRPPAKMPMIADLRDPASKSDLHRQR